MATQHKPSPLDPEGIQIQVAYPGHVQAFVIPLVALREVLRDGIHAAPEKAHYWRQHREPEVARRIEERAEQAQELVDWLDECRLEGEEV